VGWAMGYDGTHDRDIGYAVPAICDHPDCEALIDRGLAFVCGGAAFGGKHGCGLFFCYSHRSAVDLCGRCANSKPPFEPKPDLPEWVHHKLTDPSWAAWRCDNPDKVEGMQCEVKGRV